MPSRFTIPLGTSTDPKVQVLGDSNFAHQWQPEDAAGAGAAVTQAMRVARELCTRALSSLDGGDPAVAKWAAVYFLLDGPGLTQHKQTIRTIIEATANGLQASNSIKVDRVSEHGSRGFVMDRPPTDPGDRELAQLLGEDRYARAVPVKVHLETGGTVDRERGSIHVSSYLIDKPLGLVQTIIHEATHRYAGTHDAILDGTTYGYIRGGNEWIVPGITPGLALYNADSYGWFVVKVGKAFDGLIAGIAL